MALLSNITSIWQASRSPLATGVFAINAISRAVGSKWRVRNFPVTRFNQNGVFYHVNSWDGLLTLRPNNEARVHSAVATIASSKSGSGIFLNIGAHIGRYCLEFAQHFEETIAYEPTPSTFNLLKMSLQTHPCREHISLRQIAVADRVDTAKLHLSKNESQNTLVGATTSTGDCSLTTVAVPITTVDADLSTERQRKVRLMLIDVEGAESLVINGAKETIVLSRPAIIVEVLDPERRATVESILAPLGYIGQSIDDTNWLYRSLH